jgi:hypothetical protein
MEYLFFPLQFEDKLYVVDCYIEKFDEFEIISIFPQDDKLKSIAGGFFFNFLRKTNPKGPLMFTSKSAEAEKLKRKIGDTFTNL